MTVKVKFLLRKQQGDCVYSEFQYQWFWYSHMNGWQPYQASYFASEESAYEWLSEVLNRRQR